MTEPKSTASGTSNLTVIEKAMSEPIADCPWKALASFTKQVVAHLFQNLVPFQQDDETKPDIENENGQCSPLALDNIGFSLNSELITKLLKLIEHSDVLQQLTRVFSESERSRELILQLPQEDTCWYIGDIEVCQRNDRKFRLMVVIDAITSQPASDVVSVVVQSDMTYEEQALQLFCYTCCHPARKRPRRPCYIQLLKTQSTRGVILDWTQFQVNFQVSGASLRQVRQAADGRCWFRQCFGCGMRATPDMFNPCPKCKAVLYCGQECRTNSWKRQHRLWCSKFKTYMKLQDILADLPFSFSQVSVSETFTPDKLNKFLEDNDIYNQGLWRREFQDISGLNVEVGSAFGELSTEKPFVLPWEEVILESPPLVTPGFDQTLQNWADYYRLRGLWLDSPIAGLLHYPLTLYWLVVHFLPRFYPETWSKLKHLSILQVHLIGAEKEAEMFASFLEFARLLSPMEVHMHVFGDEVSPKVDGRFQHKDNLMFQVHHGLYHQCSVEELPEPDVVVGFNAGLGAYSTFLPTIKMILGKKLPLICTDYCYYSVDQSCKVLRKSQVGRMVWPKINPFRSPFRLISEDVNLPRYSNAFIYGVLPLRDEDPV